MSYTLKKCAREGCQNESTQKYCSRACAPFAYLEGEKTPAQAKRGGRGQARVLTHLGKTMTVTEWARELGIHKMTLFKRLRVMGPERALTAKDLRAVRYCGRKVDLTRRSSSGAL